MEGRAKENIFRPPTWSAKLCRLVQMHSKYSDNGGKLSPALGLMIARRNNAKAVGWPEARFPSRDRWEHKK